MRSSYISTAVNHEHIRYIHLQYTQQYLNIYKKSEIIFEQLINSQIRVQLFTHLWSNGTRQHPQRVPNILVVSVGVPTQKGLRASYGSRADSPQDANDPNILRNIRVCPLQIVRPLAETQRRATTTSSTEL